MADPAACMHDLVFVARSAVTYFLLAPFHHNMRWTMIQGYTWFIYNVDLCWLLKQCMLIKDFFQEFEIVFNRFPVIDCWHTAVAVESPFRRERVGCRSRKHQSHPSEISPLESLYCEQLLWLCLWFVFESSQTPSAMAKSWSPTSSALLSQD